jgi:hypothetical protein
MSIDFYPKNSYWLVAGGSTVQLGAYTNATWGDFALAQIRVYNKNVSAYSYQIRIVVSASLNGTSLAASEYFTFSNASTGQTTSEWLGDVTFDIAPYNFINTEVYYARLELIGYTRAARPLGDTQYLAVWCDWMQPLGTNNTGAARIAMGVNR